MSSSQKIAVIGAGKMGQMIARRLIEVRFCRTEDVCLTKGRADAVSELLERFPNSRAVGNCKEAVQDAQIVFLCVRPQNFREVAKELNGGLNPSQLIISIVTGTSFAQLEKGLGTNFLVRCSTNIGLETGNATSCWISGSSIDQRQRQLTQKIFSRWGDEKEVKKEVELELAIVALGSAPAFASECMMAWNEAQAASGMPWDLAKWITHSIFTRTPEMAKKKEKELSRLQEDVKTPGGITLQMMLLLNRGALKALVMDAFEAAYSRVQEFLKKNEEDR